MESTEQNKEQNIEENKKSENPVDKFVSDSQQQFNKRVNVLKQNLVEAKDVVGQQIGEITQKVKQTFGTQKQQEENDKDQEQNNSFIETTKQETQEFTGRVKQRFNEIANSETINEIKQTFQQGIRNTKNGIQVVKESQTFQNVQKNVKDGINKISKSKEKEVEQKDQNKSD